LLTEGEIASELTGVLRRQESNSCHEFTVPYTDGVFQHLLARSRSLPTWRR